MRSFFVIILVFNIAFALWHFAFGDDVFKVSDVHEIAGAVSVGGSQLRLVSDVIDDVAEARAGQKAGMVVDVPIFRPGEQCWMIGPFDERGQAENIQTRLSARAVLMAVRKLSTPVAPDYWVHVPPRANRQAAMLLLRQLQARDIDSSIIVEGELANGISLGFFSSEKSARSLLERHQGQLYQVGLRIVPREINEFWGLLALSEYSKLGEEGWRRFRNENTGVIMKQNLCDVVATADNFE